MKQLLVTITSFLIGLAIMSFATPDKSQGAIGDIKYSILPPAKFIEENGGGWVLMDDKIPLKPSVLNNKHGITEVPDARGMFIRGVNLTRADGREDPYAKENNGTARGQGSYQPDALKEHTHKLSGNGSYGSAYQHQSDHLQGGSDKWWAVPYTLNISVLKEGDVLNPYETRPKNIALFVYIKINE